MKNKNSSFNRSQFSVACGLVSILLGVSVIVGWHFKIPLLIQILPSFVPMQYNTALGFILSGVGLLFLNLGFLSVPFIFGFLTLLLGSLTLAQYILLVDLGLDQLFMDHYITVKTHHPGRMAPNTALCFSLVGVCLIWAGSVGRRILSLSALVFLGELIFTLSAVAAIGYLLGLETAYGWSNLTRMALHTSVGFLSLGAGIIVIAWSNDQELCTREWWVPGICAFGVVLLSILLFQANINNENILIKQKLQSQADNIRERILSEVKSLNLGLNRMKSRWERSDLNSRKLWEGDAALYLKHYYSLDSLSWVDSAYIPQWIMPPESQSRIKKYFSNSGSLLPETMNRANSLNESAFSSLTKNFQGKIGFFMVVPLNRKDSGASFLIAAVSINGLFKNALDPIEKKGFSVKIYQNGKSYFLNRTQTYPKSEFWQVNSSVRIGNNSLELKLKPSKTFVDNIDYTLAYIILFVGTLAGLLIAWVVYLYSKQHSQFNILQETARELEKAHIQNQLILHSAGDGIYGLDREGNTTFLNTAAENILGYSANELIGKPQHSVIHHTKADGSEYKHKDCHIFSSILEGKTKIVDDEVFWRKNGMSFPVEYTSTPIIESGKVNGAVVTFRDITQKKRAQTELNQFAYIVSHDLRTPLRGINHLSQFIEEDLKDDNKENLEANFALLRKRVKRMEEMVSGLLQYTRAGQLAKKVEVVNLKSLLEETIDLLSLPKSFSIHLPESLPTFNTDKLKLQQVFQNLIDNGVKHSENGKPGEIRIDFKDIDPFYEFTVSDNGKGIESIYHEKIFQMFQSLEPWDKTDNTGLGLALIKRIVEGYGGKVSVESAVGKGSSFRFSWPKEIHEL